MNKAAVLARVKELNACSEVIDYVRDHPSDDAAQIWADCTNVDWLCWFAFRHVPVGAFAFNCADRAVRQYTAATLRAAGRVDAAETLEALPPIVDRESALKARKAVRTYAYDTDAYVYYDTDAVYYAAAAVYYAANAAYAAYAAYYAAAAAYAASCATSGEEEINLQLQELHALWSAIEKVITSNA